MALRATATRAGSLLPPSSTIPFEAEETREIGNVAESGFTSKNTAPFSVFVALDDGFCSPSGRSEVTLGPGATAALLRRQRLRNRNRLFQENGCVLAIPYSTFLRFQLGNGQAVTVCH